MGRLKRCARWRARLGCGLLVLALQGAMGLHDHASAQPAAATDDSTTVRLIQLLVKNGVLKQAQADALLQQARQEAREARRAHTAARPAQAAAPAAAAGSATGAAAEAAPAVPPGTVRVTYVPELVRQQIAAEVKQQVMQEAQEDGWAAPNQVPEWVQRIKIFGDLRVRGEEDMFPSGNYPDFTDFNTINSASDGFDYTSQIPPNLDTTDNRTRFRLRARIGADAQLTDWAMAEIRLATGNDRSPVSENQTLGAGGDFSKYAIWLDRAFIRLKPTSWLTLDLGREPNPFWTTPLLFNDDLNFDGLAVKVEYPITSHVKGLFSTGIFPVFNTAFNFGSTATYDPVKSHDDYLAAVQGGVEWTINDDYVAKGALGYFDFLNVQGSESTPCVSPSAFGSCNTDDTIPGWVQFGNTLFPLRNVALTSTSTADPEYYGLASRFNILDAHGEFTFRNFHPNDIVLTADFVDNLGFNQSAIMSRSPYNNQNAADSWTGGHLGYLVQIGFGHQKLEKLWDWNLTIGYRYIETDAVLDALDDSDFHLGGTNAKGYSIVGSMALAKDLWVDGKFYAATQVSGEPYAVNVLLVDLNAKF